MELNEKTYKLKICIDMCNSLRLQDTTIYVYFNQNSEKNIEKKVKILEKLLDGKELTREEKYDRSVFELLPDIDYSKYDIEV